MNIHISCTPEFSIDKLNEIVDLLAGIPGELKFCMGRTLTQTQYTRLNEKFISIDQISSLDFEEFFDLVQGYRDWDKDKKVIDDNDFVIIISSIKNSKKWFSAFRNKNIFIHGDEWDLISDVDSKFGIAYQCVENIFQSLIDLDIENTSIEPNIHQTSIGCINDFCENKTDIIMKLQSATICPSCYQRSVDKGIDDYIMTHIISIMEEIRKEFVISKKFSKQASLEKVTVDEKGNITIGGKVIKMEVLPRVMYIGFLKNIDGIPSDKKCENKNLFEEIYIKIKKNPDELAIQKMCCSKIKHENSIERRKPTFETYRSKIKMAIKKVLGQTLASYYSVNLVEDQNKQNIFKVNLKKDQLDISTNFTKSVI
jgi:hypothetical protein